MRLLSLIITLLYHPTTVKPTLLFIIKKTFLDRIIHTHVRLSKFNMMKSISTMNIIAQIQFAEFQGIVMIHVSLSVYG